MIIHIIGVPMDLGGGRRGVDMGPSAIRIAGLGDRLRELGHKVIDEGDLTIKTQEEQQIRDQKTKYLPEIARAVRVLAKKVETIVAHGHFPLVLGGDHSIAIGTVSGIASFCKRKRKKLGLLWIDAHGDINTPHTSPSGNIHGMPLAVLLGLGPHELTSIGGSFQKLDSQSAAIIGLRSLDERERVNVRKTKVSVFTMEEIDKYGVHRVMKKALGKIGKVDFLHVSFDLDSVDPVYAPGVGTPVKGGLDYREAHLIMELLAESKQLTSLELVEVNPILDEHNKSAEFAVELVQSAFGKKII